MAHFSAGLFHSLSETDLPGSNSDHSVHVMMNRPQDLWVRDYSLGRSLECHLICEVFSQIGSSHCLPSLLCSSNRRCSRIVWRWQPKIAQPSPFGTTRRMATAVPKRPSDAANLNSKLAGQIATAVGQPTIERRHTPMGLVVVPMMVVPMIVMPMVIVPVMVVPVNVIGGDSIWVVRSDRRRSGGRTSVCWTEDLNEHRWSTPWWRCRRSACGRRSLAFRRQLIKLFFDLVCRNKEPVELVIGNFIESSIQAPQDRHIQNSCSRNKKHWSDNTKGRQHACQFKPTTDNSEIGTKFGGESFMLRS